MQRILCSMANERMMNVTKASRISVRYEFELRHLIASYCRALERLRVSFSFPDDAVSGNDKIAAAAVETSISPILDDGSPHDAGVEMSPRLNWRIFCHCLEDNNLPTTTSGHRGVETVAINVKPPDRRQKLAARHGLELPTIRILPSPPPLVRLSVGRLAPTGETSSPTLGRLQPSQVEGKNDRVNE